eukprot:gb/GFBE01009640.1/.p1 GENE.gb/GFBE01009640.1/~~gb/GFBE01009640.1/.p1  ORF type:complete len:172 (+),score=27.35 gb/GFBE01009640.1/:1-516(+)
MGSNCSDLKKNCGKECERDRKCYVDQNEVKFGPFDPNYYPSGANPAIGDGGGGAQQPSVLAIPGTSSRSTVATSCYSAAPGQQLAPQSVTWADGLFRKTAGVFLGRFQLTPKASSFAGGGPGGHSGPPSQRAALTFEQQMGLVNAGRGNLSPSQFEADGHWKSLENGLTSS